ncbi:MAG: hypothetical protein KatS3mg103_1085 [Phycisphaerales bacterium]|nr:MAG: hypothetical protein KatS3mg103_1085 [Phycisphaerales bacterium]
MPCPTRTIASAACLLACAGWARATWSILLVDTRTGEVAVGSATCLTGFDLRAATPVLLTGVGAATAQSFVDSTGRNRVRIRDGLALGATPDQILADLASFDPGHATRQYGIVDTLGRAGTFTGSAAGAWAGGVVGQIDGIVYAVQGNLLTSPAVVDDAVQAIIDTPGDLAEKLMAAMEAARAAGGDARCSCPPLPVPCGTPPPGFAKSADVGYMMIARAGDQGACNGLYRLDLPLADLCLADATGDGVPDVLAAEDNGARIATSAGLVAAVLNDAGGGLRQGPVGATAMDATVLDAAELTGDGRDELVGIHRSRRQLVVVALAGTGFTQTTADLPRTPFWAAVGRVTDPAGRQIVVGVSDPAADLMTFRLSDGALEAVDAVGTGLFPRSFVLADLTADGFDELVGLSGDNLAIVGNAVIDGKRGLTPGPGCAAGSYHLNLNVAFQGRGDPDPVVQLRGLFDQWRSDWVGLVDAVRSEVHASTTTLAPGQALRLRIVPRDWQGLPADRSTSAPRLRFQGVPQLTATDPILADGAWTLDVRADAASPPGQATIAIAFDDPAAPRPVTLMPALAIEVASSCPADRDGDGRLTAFDFLAFLNAFDAGDPSADCDGSGTLDALDLACFQTTFDAGC